MKSVLAFEDGLLGPKGGPYKDCSRVFECGLGCIRVIGG